MSHPGERLYPIIRRARRPLIIEDDDSGPAPPAPAVTVLQEQVLVNYAKPSSLAKKGKRAAADASESKQ